MFMYKLSNGHPVVLIFENLSHMSSAASASAFISISDFLVKPSTECDNKSGRDATEGNH